MNSKQFLEEAKKLHKLGIAVHWLRKNSKAPMKMGWSRAPKDTWKEILSSYQKGCGLGIRLGQPSMIDGRFLTAIDFDVRSKDPKYFKEAKALLEQEFPGLYEKAAFVKTGRGFGSCHLYFLNESLEESRNVGRSDEKVKVYSPSSPMSKEQDRYCNEGLITKSELLNGVRLKTAWEIDFMAMGKQVVAPPTVHPDTQKPYEWVRGLE